jgi:DNA polymerase III delta prime subunit
VLDKVSVTQPEIAAILCNQIRQGSLPGSMLFCGPEFAGKLHCAYQLALQMGSVKEGNFALSSNRDFEYQICFALDCYRNKPCQATSDFLLENFNVFLAQFHNCLATDDRDQKAYDSAGLIMELLSDLHDASDRKLSDICDRLKSVFLDTVRLMGKKSGSLSISQVRSIQQWACLTSMGRSDKIVVLEGIEDANESVRNSLLKILEEPPSGIRFILITSLPERMLATILSRTRRYQFPAISLDAKAALLGSLGKRDSDRQRNLKEYFISYASSEIPEVSRIASGFLNDSDFNLLNILKILGDSRSSMAFFNELSLEVEREFSAGRMTEYRAKELLRLISDTASSSRIFNQNPRLAVEGLFYSVRQKKRFDHG